MKTLQTILNGIHPVKVQGNLSQEVTGIESDSRSIRKGHVFVAVKGTQVDGHLFISKAIELGAVAIVCEVLPESYSQNVVMVQVSNSAKALGIMASNFYGNPSEKLKLVGVTGTNGKTTTVTLLHQMFSQLGYKAGLISTIRNIVHNVATDSTHTTPDPLLLNKLLAEMVECGCDYCFMEVSSHAVHQHRIAGLTFAGGVFSNLTQDHLDYHGTLAEYLKAKKAFFDNLPKGSFALVNVDDKNGRVMVQNTKATVKTYALGNMANYHGKIMERHFDGMLLTFNQQEFWVKFIGDFNAYNLLAVYGVALSLGANEQQVCQILSNLNPVDGRFQYLKSKKGQLAVVDYAHTPDALENVLNTLKQLRGGNQQIITVFGAGGNRDKTKRPIMGKIAAQGSDKVIITSDNPRNENPDDIIADIQQGIMPPFNRKVLAISNRTEAIKTACMMAKDGDIILVAGKGHETYQEINGVKHHFDDREVLRELFEQI